jgi:hypothetical protein
MEGLVPSLWLQALVSGWVLRWESFCLPCISVVVCLSLLCHCWRPFLVFYACGPHVVQERHSGPTLRRQWQTFVGIHHRLVSEFSVGCSTLWGVLVPKHALECSSTFLIHQCLRTLCKTSEAWPCRMVNRCVSFTHATHLGYFARDCIFFWLDSNLACIFPTQVFFKVFTSSWWTFISSRERECASIKPLKCFCELLQFYSSDVWCD